MRAAERPFDIGTMPELIAMAEEVARTGVPRLLRSAGRDLAVIVPPPRKNRGRRTKTAADFEAFRAAAGSWAGVDTDALLDTIRADRARSSRPPVTL